VRGTANERRLSAEVCAWMSALALVALEPANVLSFVAGAFLASLGEYWGHRLLHLDLAVAEVHREHHRLNVAQGVLLEALDYIKGGLVCCLPLASVLWLWIAPSAALALTAGAALYGVFAAYAHQLQHENPRGCFWMAMPVHYVHHKFNMKRWNFGIAVDFWDRVFGTYKVVAWDGARERAAERRGLLRIKWR
jgi:sterol desaturase/sphingolipid hydroxylase (fatty acid hydroxylase superfamily)